VIPPQLLKNPFNSPLNGYIEATRASMRTASTEEQLSYLDEKEAATETHQAMEINKR
jgi:hypothetical protein